MKIDCLFADKFVALLKKKATNLDELILNLLSGNPIITMAYVQQHPELKWCWQGLTYNPSVSIKYIEVHPEYPWNDDEFHLRKYGGEAEPVMEYLSEMNAAGRPCEWNGHNITIGLIEKHLDWIKEQDDDDAEIIWHQISDNPNLTLEFIEKNYSNLYVSVLASNPLRAAKAQFRHEQLAAA